MKFFSRKSKWMTLAELPKGAIFEDQDGDRAVKSEYYYDNENPQPLCILLTSGEYAHYKKKELTIVREIYL